MYAVTYNTPSGRWVRDISLPTNQMDCNSCWAIATCQVMTDRLRLENKIRLSDELNYYNLYNYIHDHDPNLGSCVQGAYDNTGRIVSVEEGAPLMSKSPDHEFGVREYPGDRYLHHYKAQSWYKLHTIDEVKLDLDHYGSVTCILTLYPSWMNFMGLGPYIPGLYEEPTGELHMASMVGYDDRDRTFIVRNSYGSDWGSQGFVKIKQTDQKLHVLDSIYAPIV